jgi:anaerobic dimethyl sulfoxide reductase subunit B
MAKQMAFYFNASACTGCKACAIACQDRNSLPVEIRWRRIYQYGGGSWTPHPYLLLPNNVFVYSLSISCMHCEEPACVDVCPTGAMTKRSSDGIVLVDQTKCIGCRYCEWACPYGAPQFDTAAGVMTKCDFCQDLQAEGKDPACVDACVMRALEFGDLQELRAKYGDVDAIEPLPTASITKPAIVITPHPRSETSGEGSGRLLNLPEEV